MWDIRPLTMDDAGHLLRFELDNRAWFERFIQPRPDSFYTPTGVRLHIRQFLQENRQGKRLPRLIIHRESGVIVGRVNLHNLRLDQGSAFIGYRVAQSIARQGAAKRGVDLIQHEARLLGIRTLLAYVVSANLASQKVLQHHGFKVKQRLPDYVSLHGQKLDCLYCYKQLYE
ncbi:GNAT family N-acetyltransferase [Terasakiispira papahanaumokuakeensis]|nr:GNAT family N-acetyltransferase [Terasakiispira papahanaumokuakeensis]